MNVYYPTCERHVAPPKTSVQLAEYHGAIDAAVASVAPAARAQAAWSIVSKEDGTFHDRHVTDSTTGQYRTVEQPGRSIVTPPFTQPAVALAIASGQPAFTGNQDITPRGTALQPGQYMVFDTDGVVIPYLPDPNATGVAIQGLGASPVFRAYGARAGNASGGAWPELAPFRLVLSESRAGLTFSNLSSSVSGASGASVVALPPATTLDLTYSSTLDSPTAHAFGPTATSDALHPSAQKGLIPALAPSRQLTLVHAVQRPKTPTLFAGDVSVLQRAEGETVQTVQANLRFDGASSGRVDLIASWDEYVDAPSGTTPEEDPTTKPVRCSGAIASLTPAVNETTSFQQVRQLFGDTKRRDLTFTTVATTRFREYFPPAITSDASNITTSATMPTQVICRSSARPPIPKVLYAVPSFAFSATESGSTATRTRAGGIVRVYVDRGWFASGADERLGVVLAQNPGDEKKLANLVSVWGPDPIWSHDKLNPLDASHVSAANVAEIAYGVPLAEGVGTVNVATYKPSFNAARGLWYFDIGISPDQAYFPFLRLALVRYQPQSIGSLHASSVVCTEFVQLSANRTASVVSLGNDKYSVTLSGPTASNLKVAATTAEQAASGHYVTAEFQEALTASPDPIDWSVLGSRVTLAPTSFGPGGVTYQATMTFPVGSAVTGSKRRILLREHEVYVADAQTGVRDNIGLVQIGEAATSYKLRLVYADAIAIP
jgi:hypothetical protein